MSHFGVWTYLPYLISNISNPFLNFIGGLSPGIAYIFGPLVWMMVRPSRKGRQLSRKPQNTENMKTREQKI